MDTNISVNTGHSLPDSIPVQESGCGARGSLQRASKQGAVHGLGVPRSGFLYMEIYAACCSSPGPHQEYKGLTDDFPWESTGDKIIVKNGSMPAPNVHGIGVDIDPNYLAKADRV